MFMCSLTKVVFLGGLRVFPSEPNDSVTRFRYVSQRMKETLWYGELANDGRSMHWNEVDTGRFGSFFLPTCFFLKDNLYIFESWAEYNIKLCDRYDFHERKYYHNVFIVPPQLISNSIYSPKIRTNADETFALIFVRIRNKDSTTIKEKFWIFTENDGFKELSDLETTIGRELNWDNSYNTEKPVFSNFLKKTELIRIK